MKTRRHLILSLLTLLLIVGIPTGFVLSEYHHVQVNRALIAAVKADDTNTALAALNAGAEADYPQNENVPRPVWIQWLHRIAGLKAPARQIEPSLLAQAVQHNNTILVKALLEKGATDVQGLIVSHQFKDSPVEPILLLAAAAEADNLEMCQALVEHGADVNLGGNEYPLKMAANRGHSEVIRLLLAHGANARFASRWGSVLNEAVYGGNLSVVTLLVEAGADVNIGGKEVGSPLQNAAEAGNVEIVCYLLQKGVKVNAEVRWNLTPLMEAVKGNHAAVVKLLLAHGADWRTKVEEDGTGFTKGDTALRIAQRRGNKEIVQMLKNAGAKK